MASTLDRLRAALRPDYEIERELGAGGMGRVFQARDVTLDRPVAVKILRPELATAQAAERLLTEARTLARLRHPNVVPIHRAGEAAGFLYYVMDLVEGETLADRLRRGRLAPDEVIRLGRDVLAALGAVHQAGIVHRDIKPSNVFLAGSRGLLADFGISATTALASAPQDARAAGTPGYMPPEQWFGWGSTPATDLYAVGMVLYEALTGRRWEYLLPDQTPDWSGIPGYLAPVLRRALAWEPERRWASAADFGAALRHARLARRRRRATAIGAVWLVVVAPAAVLLLRPHAPAPADLAILPFALSGDVDPAWRADLATLVHHSLGMPQVLPLTTALGLAADREADTARWFDRRDARAVLAGSVSREGDAFTVRFRIVQADGGQLVGEPIRTDSLAAAGCRIASEVVRLVWPNRVPDYRCPQWLQGAGPRAAVAAFLGGERAFRRQQWDAAESHFADALELDSSFALAAWRLANARAWLREFTAVDLDALYRQRRDELGELDRLLLDAWRTPFGAGRLALYATAVSPRKYHRDPYAWLSYGDDLFNRGALIGIPLDSSRRVIARAAALDSTLAPAFLDLAWAAIRLGDRDGAATAVRRLAAITPAGAIIPPEFLALAYYERFAPDSAAPYLASFGGDGRWSPTADRFVAVGLRWASSFDLAGSEARVADDLLRLRDVPSHRVMELYVARGLGQFGQGGLVEAFASFDSAAAAAGTAEARVNAAEWRVVPAALGFPGVPADEVERGRTELIRLATIDAITARAAWVLALDAYIRGDVGAAATWTARLEPVDGAGRDLAQALAALALATRGDLAAALARSDSLVPRVAADVPAPFFRSALALLRGAWRARLGRSPEADWVWYENADVRGWPGGLPQAGEVDWAFGSWGRWLRAQALLSRGHRAAGCALLSRTIETWEHATDHALRDTAIVAGRPCTR